MSATVIPFIDPTVEHVGVSRLRSLNAEVLRNIDKTMVLQDNDTPLAVLLKYEQFLTMQNRMNSLLETIEVLTNKAELGALKAGFSDVQAGRVKKASETKESHKNKK